MKGAPTVTWTCDVCDNQAQHLQQQIPAGWAAVIVAPISIAELLIVGDDVPSAHAQHLKLLHVCESCINKLTPKTVGR